MSSNVILPVGKDRTLTIFEWFFAEPGTGSGWESMQQGIAFSDQIQQEDIILCEQVQRGLRSRSYDAGRFSAKRENGVFHFQELVREFLASDDSRPAEPREAGALRAAPRSGAEEK
jgi:choline monooxygenase